MRKRLLLTWRWSEHNNPENYAEDCCIVETQTELTEDEQLSIAKAHTLRINPDASVWIDTSDFTCDVVDIEKIEVVKWN